LLGVGLVVGKDRDSDAGGGRHRIGPALDRPAHFLQDPVGDPRRFGRFRLDRSNDDKFVATKPRNRIATPDRTFEPARRRDKNRIADRMSERVVDRLEPVKIDVQDRNPPTIAARRGYRFFEFVGALSPVRQIGQHVMQRRVFDLCLGVEKVRGPARHRPGKRPEHEGALNQEHDEKHTGPRRPGNSCIGKGLDGFALILFYGQIERRQQFARRFPEIDDRAFDHLFAAVLVEYPVDRRRKPVDLAIDMRRLGKIERAHVLRQGRRQSEAWISSCQGRMRQEHEIAHLCEFLAQTGRLKIVAGILQLFGKHRRTLRQCTLARGHRHDLGRAFHARIDGPQGKIPRNTDQRADCQRQKIGSGHLPEQA